MSYVRLFRSISLPLVLVVAACGQVSGPIPLRGPVIQIELKNETTASISVRSAQLIDVGESLWILDHSPDTSKEPSYALRFYRENETDNDVVYRIRKFPGDGETVNILITVTEPSPGVFEATSAVRAWVEIIEVRPRV